MKGLTTIFFALFLCSLSAQEQKPEPITQVLYRIDYFKADSMYLVEVRVKQTAGALRPEITEVPIFASDTAQISAMIASVKKQAEDTAKKAAELSLIAGEVFKVYADLRERIKAK